MNYFINCSENLFLLIPICQQLVHAEHTYEFIIQILNAILIRVAMKLCLIKIFNLKAPTCKGKFLVFFSISLQPPYRKQIMWSNFNPSLLFQLILMLIMMMMIYRNSFEFFTIIKVWIIHWNSDFYREIY